MQCVFEYIRGNKTRMLSSHIVSWLGFIKTLILMHVHFISNAMHHKEFIATSTENYTPTIIISPFQSIWV